MTCRHMSAEPTAKNNLKTEKKKNKKKYKIEKLSAFIFPQHTKALADGKQLRKRNNQRSQPTNYPSHNCPISNNL